MAAKDVFCGNESNLRTVDKIIVLTEEIAVLQSRFEDNEWNPIGRTSNDIKPREITSDLKTSVNVLKNRVQELKERVHD